MALTGIRSVSVYVNDVDRALDFYTNKLGFHKHDDSVFPYEGRDLRWVTVTIGDSGIDLVLIKGFAGWTPESVGKSPGIVFSVEDIVGTFKQLEANGVTITEQPNGQEWGLQGQFVDSEGNSYVVVGQ